MQACGNTVKTVGMYKDVMKFLLRCTKVVCVTTAPRPTSVGADARIRPRGVEDAAPYPAPQNKNTVRC